MLSQYDISLGNADTGNIDDPYVWTFYILTTLFTQITFFNMLIGIMGQTFERVTADRDKNSLMERTKMYADFLWCLHLDKEIENKRYLYVIKPEEEDDKTEIEGSISSVKRNLKKMEKALFKQLTV